MKLLKDGDRRVLRIIQKDSADPQKEYRLSKWVFPFETDGAIVLRSSLSKRVYMLEPEEWAAVCEGQDFSPAVEELVKQRFLVETSFDDYAQYSLVLSVLRSLASRKPGADSFTILTTTGCNARCTYCYQQGTAVKTMTPAIAEQTVRYICAEKREGPIRICWFGGEPLCAPHIISQICAGLREKGVAYSSSIVTNGSLFTKELIREAVTLWNLDYAQVSMDGEREDYEKRKRYLDPARYNYDVVMDVIQDLCDAGVRVTIRCNCDLENLPGMYRFLDECADRFLKTGKVAVQVSGLLQEVHPQAKVPLSSLPEMSLAEYAEAKGFPKQRESSEHLAVNQCMADSGGKSHIIDPSGGLHACDYYIGTEATGSVFDTEPFTWPAFREPAQECLDCCFLPDCTANFKKHCPLCPPDCRKLKQTGTENKIKEILQGKHHNDDIASEEAPFSCL